MKYVGIYEVYEKNGGCILNIYIYFFFIPSEDLH
jgi:hypothetical protein